MFKDYILVKKWKNEKTYQILKPKSEVKQIGVLEPKEIEIYKDHVEILNDIVYYFQHIKIGKGSDIKTNRAELSKKAKLLNRLHPLFFRA